MTDRKIRNLTAFAVFLVSLTVYMMTMAVSVSFWDAGEFIATSYILGIPHSPGTPMYILVGRVFSMLPLPLSIAQKVNFLSAFTAALGVAIIYLVISSVLGFMFGKPKTAAERFARFVGPAVGSLFLTFSDTYWTNAIEAEVYALSAFVMGLCVLLALKWLKGHPDTDPPDGQIVDTGGSEESSRGLVLLIIYLLSLGIGFHLGTILVYGGIFLLILMVKNKSFSNFELIVITFGMAILVADMTLHRNSTLTLIGLGIFGVLLLWSAVSKGRFAVLATLLFILGVSVHLYMYIRSFHNPAIDMVDPEKWEAMYAHLRREQYPPINIAARKASLSFQFRHFFEYFQNQFRLFGDVLLGPFNLGKASVAIPAALGFWGLASNYMRDRKTFILNAANLALNSLGLIIFLNFSDSEVRERDYFYGGAFFFFSIFIGIGATSLMVYIMDDLKEKLRDASKWAVAVGIVLLICAILPSGYHWFTHDRSNDWVARDYGFNLLAGLEPDAIIFTNGDNDTYPLWYIQNVEGFRQDVTVANLQLLNTGWYIKQLRDRQPGAPIAMSDEEIDRMRPMALADGSIAWVKDLSIQHIIQQTHWKRPIYFAVSTPHDAWKPYEKYLEMQGMTRRLIPHKGDYQTNEFMIKRNIEDLFSFRGYLTPEGESDQSVYKSKDTRGMFHNFGVASMELARLSALRRDYVDALKYTKMTANLSSTIEFPNRLLGLYYARNDQFDKGVEHYEKLLEEYPDNGDYWIGLSRVYAESGDIERALTVLHRAANAAPDEKGIFMQGFYYAAQLERLEEAKNFARQWLQGHPNDREATHLIENFDQILLEEFGVKVPPDSSDR
jgi:tetratricopeptide (TPR) repeat protein